MHAFSRIVETFTRITKTASHTVETSAGTMKTVSRTVICRGLCTHKRVVRLLCSNRAECQLGSHDVNQQQSYSPISLSTTPLNSKSFSRRPETEADRFFFFLAQKKIYTHESGFRPLVSRYRPPSVYPIGKATIGLVQPATRQQCLRHAQALVTTQTSPQPLASVDGVCTLPTRLHTPHRNSCRFLHLDP